MGRAVRFVSGYLPSGVGSVSLLASDRTDQPTAAIIKSVKSTGGVENGAAHSIAVTDFSTSAILTGFDLHNTSLTQTGREHITGTTNQGVRLLDAVDGTAPYTPIKIANFARVDGGLQLNASIGSAYAVQAALFFEWNASVVNTAGDGNWEVGEAIALSHTLGVPAGLGFVFGNGLFDAAGLHMNLSMGMFIDEGSFDEDAWVSAITQYCAAYRWQNGLSTTNTAGRIFSNRVAALGNNSGGAFSAQEVTANDVNLMQITNRDGGTVGSGVIALLLDTQGVDVGLDVIDLPASAGADWEYDDSEFHPGAIFGVMTQYTALDTGAGSALAGAYTLVGWDDLGGVMSAGMAAEDNVSTTNTASHANDSAIQHYDHQSTLTHQIDDLTFTADGFDVDQGDLTATGSAKFICAFFPPSITTPENAIQQVGEIEGLAVLYDDEINVAVYGADFGASGTVQLSNYDIQSGESPGAAVTQTQVSYADGEIRFDVDLGALSPGSLYLTVTPTAGDPSTVQVTVNANPGTATVARRAASASLNVTQGVPLTPQNLARYFHKTDAQDTVTYTADVLPAGLSLSGTAISGTISSAAAVLSPYTVTITCTDSFGHSVDDTLTWTIAAPAGEVIPKVQIAQFQTIGPDLWDTDDDETSMVLRFVGLKKTDGKRWLEEQIYQPLGLYSPVLADGSLGLRRSNPILTDAPYVAVLDEDSFIQIGALEHDFEALINRVVINWNYDLIADRRTRTTALIDADSINIHGTAPIKTLNWDGLHGSRHTDAILKKRIDSLRDKYAAPPIRLTGTLLHSYNRLEVGDVVRVRLQNVRDYTGSSGPFDRSMEIQRIAIDQVSGEVRVNLLGSSRRASVLAPDEGPALPDGWYTGQGTALTSVCTIVAGVVQAGSYDLTGHASLNNAAAIYYYAGDLELADGATFVLTDNVQLRVRGFFEINGDIVGTAGGVAGASDDEDIDNANPGTAGYVGSTRGWGGLNRYTVSGGVSYFKANQAPQVDGLYTAAPYLDLSVLGGELLGLPRDLRGTSGGIGGRIVGGGAVLAGGGDGGAGGAGLALISRGATVGLSGSINLSGGDGGLGESITLNGKSHRAGTGAPGGPGSLLCVLDGSAPSVPNLLDGLTAAYGAIPTAGSTPTSESAISLHWTDVAEPFSGYDQSIGGDISASALRIQRLAKEQDPQEDIIVPAPKNFGVATNGAGTAHVLTCALPPAECVTEFFASITNDRGDAVLVASSTAGRFDHIPAPNLPIYYWARNRNIQTLRVSRFNPDGTTSTFVGAPLAVPGGGEAGPPGAPGTPGTSVHVATIYRRSATQPSTPSGGSYNFGTQTLTPPSLWAASVPASNGNPCWSCSGTFSVVGSTGIDSSTTWSTAAKLVEDGADGVDGLSVYVATVYRRSSSAPSTPTGGAYNFGTQVLTPPTNWSVTIPSGGNPLYSSQAPFSVQGTTGTDNSTTWSTPVKLDNGGQVSVGADIPAMLEIQNASLGAGPTIAGFRFDADGDFYVRDQSSDPSYTSRFTWIGDGTNADYQWRLSVTNSAVTTGTPAGTGFTLGTWLDATSDIQVALTATDVARYFEGRLEIKAKSNHAILATVHPLLIDSDDT